MSLYGWFRVSLGCCWVGLVYGWFRVGQDRFTVGLGLAYGVLGLVG